MVTAVQYKTMGEHIQYCMFQCCKLNSKPIILSKQKLQSNYVLIGLSSVILNCIYLKCWAHCRRNGRNVQNCLLIMEWRRGFGQYRLSFRGWITVCIIDKLLFVRDVWLSSSLSSEFMSHCLEYDLLIRRSCDLNRRPLPPLSEKAV